MSIIFQDGFDHYGDGVAEGNPDAPLDRALTFGWAVLSGVIIGDPLLAGAALPARSGRGAMCIPPQSGGTQLGARLVLVAAGDEMFFHWAAYMESLPDDNVSCRFIELLDNTASFIGALFLNSDGSLGVRNEANTLLYTTSPNTIVAGTWHSIQYHIKKHATLGVFELKVNGVDVVSHSAQNTGASDIAQVRFRQNGSQSVICRYWLDDLVINDPNGTRNTTFLGDVRMGIAYPRLDDETGWTANRRTKFGNGILQLDNDSALSCSDSSQVELGSGDYTIETFARFLGVPGGTDRAVLFSKWRESTNERSFRFFLGSASVNNGHLQLEISTDGLAGSVVNVVNGVFSPVPEHWYHVVVQREAGFSCILVDGVPLSAPQADASTYHDNASLLVVGGQQNGAGTVEAAQGIDGFLEETRYTKGVARYNMSGFVPPSAAFGRNSLDDPDFSSVSLLMGYDSSVADESSFGRAVTKIGEAARYAVNDQAPGAFKTVNNPNPIDDTGIEAPFTAASNVLTFTGQPANADTIEVDSNTYTFETVFSDTAGSVLIGASVNASIDNLVAAINGDIGAGTVYGTGTTPSADASAFNIDNDQMQVGANTPGTAGNALTADESCANADWADAGGTLVGGLDIPGPSSFLLTRLPPATTGVKAITLVARARKTDTGDGSIQTSFVTADNSTANGVEHALTTTDAFYADIVETDPSTSNALAPASFIGARIRIDRTE